MRHKPLPPPPDDLSTVREARDAVPLVPEPEADCCARLQRRLDLPGRDDAATWLAFLRALGLAAEGRTGFRRARTDLDDGTIAEAFLSAVYGAREVREALVAADGPLAADTVADRTAALATAWERRKHGPGWPRAWRERTGDLLGWLVLLGLAERADDGYRAATPE